MCHSTLNVNSHTQFHSFSTSAHAHCSISGLAVDATAIRIGLRCCTMLLPVKMRTSYASDRCEKRSTRRQYFIGVLISSPCLSLRGVRVSQQIKSSTTWYCTCVTAHLLTVRTRLYTITSWASAPELSHHWVMLVQGVILVMVKLNTPVEHRPIRPHPWYFRRHGRHLDQATAPRGMLVTKTVGSPVNIPSGTPLGVGWHHDY